MVSSYHDMLLDRAESAAPDSRPGDRSLLERFLAQGDDAAFAALIERHGPMVWGVCRRLLHVREDAEDAFQAVFLILFRQARSIRKSEAVGSWLYGVAYRTAMKARRNRVRRQVHEPQATQLQPTPEPSNELAAQELQRALDQEVQNLAEKYRAPFVLCLLEGMSRAEAARELGWTEGTLSGRLARARELLQTRLARRGISLSAVLTAAALSQGSAGVAPPPGLVAARTGERVTLRLSAASATLADSVLRDMAKARFVLAFACLAMVGMLVAGTGLVAFHRAQKGRQQASIKVSVIPNPARRQAGPGQMPNEPVDALAFSPDGRKLVMVGAVDEELGYVKLWNLSTAKELVAVREALAMTAVAFSPDGNTLACGQRNGGISLRDAETARERTILRAHELGVKSLSFSPDGTALVSAGLDGTVRLWQVSVGGEPKVFRGHVGAVLSVAFCPHGRAFVTGGADRTARVWDVASGRELLTLRGHLGSVESVTVSPDGKILASAGGDATVRLWDAATGDSVVTLDASQPVRVVAFSPDGKCLASAAGKTIQFWDPRTHEPAGHGLKQSIPIRALAFSPQGNLLANGTSFGAVLLAVAFTADDDPETWQEYRQSFKGLTEVPPGWELKGDEAEQCVRFEPEGLRITLPLGKPPTGRGTGVTTFQPVKGDFEITMTFEIFHEPEPRDVGTRQSRVSLEVLLDKPMPSKNMAAVTRRSDRAGPGFSAWQVLTEEDGGPPRTQSGSVATGARTGRLRLQRSGGLLSYYVAEGPDGEFTLLRQFPFGQEDLREFRICASTGGPKASFDVRITDLHVRSKSLPGTTPAEDNVQEGSLPLILALGLANLLGLGAWLYLRRRRGTGKEVPAVSFACTGCGKHLKARVESAGRTLHCPNCRGLIVVPNTTPITKADEESGSR